MPAWSWHFAVHDIIKDSRGKVTACDQLLVFGIPLDKWALHTKGNQLCEKKEPCIRRSVQACQFFLFCFRDGSILHRQVVNILQCFIAVGHQGQKVFLNCFGKSLLALWFGIVRRNFGTDLRLSRHPTTDQSIIQWKITAFRTVHKIFKYFV